MPWPDAGGFQVHAHQRSSQDEVGGQLVRETFYLHGFVKTLRSGDFGDRLANANIGHDLGWALMLRGV